MTETMIMTIGGGPRKEGASAQMLQCFTDCLTQAAVGHCLTLRHYDAYDCAFAPCIDCRACRESEGCVFDDMEDFWHDFETADGIVFASPVYNLSFPAPMKAIIDRMQRYYSARFFLGKRPPIAKYRPAALLLSAGSPDEDGNVAARQLERIFTVTHCELVCRGIVNGTDRPAGDEEPYLTPDFGMEALAAGFWRRVSPLSQSHHKSNTKYS